MQNPFEIAGDKSTVQGQCFMTSRKQRALAPGIPCREFTSRYQRQTRKSSENQLRQADWRASSNDELLSWALPQEHDDRVTSILDAVDAATSRPLHSDLFSALRCAELFGVRCQRAAVLQSGVGRTGFHVR